MKYPKTADIMTTLCAYGAARRMNRSQIAKASGISQGYFSELYNGKKDLSIKNIVRICKAVDVEFDLVIQTQPEYGQ